MGKPTTGPVRTSTVFHTSPRRNLLSLLRTGVQHTLARGKMEVVWTTARRLVRWAQEHTRDRHHTERTVTLELAVPAEELTRRKDGIFTLARTVRPEEIVAVNGLRIYEP